eukprot:scaffold3715_cov37-Tisochrysis_lutea.AAC.5
MAPRAERKKRNRSIAGVSPGGPLSNVCVVGILSSEPEGARDNAPRLTASAQLSTPASCSSHFGSVDKGSTIPSFAVMQFA